MSKYKKAILNAVFMIALVLATGFFVLRGRDINKIVDLIQYSNDWWLLLGVVFVLLFICGESVIMKYLFHVLGSSVGILKCIKYSFIGFFFSSVTPSATGGQPMQLYYMGKDKHKVSKSCLVLLIITIGYKAALVVMSSVLMLVQGEIVIDNLDSVIYILIYGIIVNLLFILFLFIIIFNPNWTENIILFFARLFHRLHIVKDISKFREKIMEQMQPYRDGAEYLKTHVMVFFNVLGISILQRTALFLVTWCVYKSYGLHSINAVQIVTLQSIISLSVDMLPLPGGIGASEKSFEILFDRIFGAELVIPGMILSRGISFYFLVFITGLVTIVAQFRILSSERKNKNNKCEGEK